MFFKILTITAFVFSLNVFAKDFDILTIKNDQDSEITHLVLNVDDTTNDIKELRKDTYNCSGQFVRKEIWGPESIAQGIVLHRVSGYDVIKIQSNDFTPATGGHIDIAYLANGITHKYQTLALNLLFEEENFWAIEHENRRLISIFCESKKVFGKVVGIKEMHLTYAL